MKLLRLTLENFRQFRDQQEIEFATGEHENVTLIWGTNGSGKTTLLNAFTWVLYGSFTKDFEQPDRIYNLDAWSSLPDGDRMKVAVELEFENDDQILTARRESIFRKADGNALLEDDAKLTLTFVDETGRSQRSGNPSEKILQILPDRLHNFFFFNGERIEHLVQASAYEEIEDAIKTILGLTVVERAIKHLPKTAKSFEDVLRTHGSDEQRDVAAKLEDLDNRLQEVTDLVDDSRRHAGIWQDEIDAFDEKLRGSEQVRDKQRQRDDLNGEEARLSKEIETLGERLNLLIRERGFFAPGLELFESTAKQFVDKREKKELPAPVKKDFIEDLLADQTCICGASLAEGTAGHKHIMEWTQRAGLAEVEQRWNELHSHAGFFISQRRDMGRELDILLGDRDNSISRRQHVREQLSQLSLELQGTTDDDIAKLEGARVASGRRKDEEIRKQGRYELELESLAEKKTKLETQLKRAASGEAKAEQARRRLTVTRDALAALGHIYEIRTEQTRSSLDQEIKQIYGAITFKSNVPQVSPTFQLDLFDRDSGEPAAKSTGENQILSLSFVGALAKIARIRYEETRGMASSTVGARGGIYPIVMDAPFGNLDQRYRRDVALGLPVLAEQVVVMVSKSGGQENVKDLQDRVGKSYVIRYVTPKADAEPESIIIDDNEYSYVESSDDGSEYASLTEVK